MNKEYISVQRFMETFGIEDELELYWERFWVQFRPHYSPVKDEKGKIVLVQWIPGGL